MTGARSAARFATTGSRIIGYRHHLAAISVVGTGLSLPIDAEPYGPGDSEYAAGKRLLGRAVNALGGRFADYVVVDSNFAKARSCTPPRRPAYRCWPGCRETYRSYQPRLRNASVSNRPLASTPKETTASRSGTRTISTRGRRSTGRPCVFSATGSTSPMAK